VEKGTRKVQGGDDDEVDAVADAGVHYDDDDDSCLPLKCECR